MGSSPKEGKRLKNSTLFIRADADAGIGAGHVMRCFALAQAWRDRCGDVAFISRCESDALKAKIHGEGFMLTPVKRPCPDRSDLETAKAILKDGGSWLILDGYHFTPEYQKAVLDTGNRLLVIDDMNHWPEYHADMLLNQNIYAPAMEYRAAHATVLSGTRYALLRREFRPGRKRNRRRIPRTARKVLVSLGGGDTDNITLKVTEALMRIGIPRMEVKIVVGPLNKNRSMLAGRIRRYAGFELIADADNMHDLMAWADVAVTAGGSTCWEIAYMGLPFILLMTAENQRGNAEALQREFPGCHLGWGHEVSVDPLALRLKDLMIDPQKREHMSSRCQQVVDGGGNRGLIRLMTAERIRLRPVRSGDCERIWRWANDVSVRAISFSQAPIPWKDHIRWFEERITRPYFYLALNQDNIPIGQVRFDQEDTETFISVMIDGLYRRRGYGVALIMTACERMFSESEALQIHAYLRPENRASRNAFASSGFRALPESVRQNGPAHHLVVDRTF